jgi:alkanesulfonate monooxygenase SsuD/methylene tetrahydromethanopterin reductase-like flavin-dependent oxidoreductase (luciferase family)
MTGKIGVAFSGGLNASEIVDCAVLAEERGYESVWVAEGHGGDQFAVLAGCAMRTKRVRLGTAISSVFVRTAPTIAMAAATLDELSHHRFVLGLGSSHKVQVEPEHGLVYEKPIQRMRETIAFVRELLHHGEASIDGEVLQIERFDLWFKPSRPEIPIYASAVFPKMTEICGEIADGIILTRSAIGTGARVRHHLNVGAAVAGRNPDNLEITSLMPCAVADERTEAYAAIRPGLAFYAGFFPRYNRLIADHGFEDEANTIREAWKNGDKAGAERAVTDRLIAGTSVAGTPSDCRERIEAYRDSGIELPIISPFARTGDVKRTFADAIRACCG